MGADQELLFGKIAVNRKYCTAAQLEKCIVLQANSRDRVPLGQLLRSEGYITEEQHSEILAIQRKNLSIQDPVSKASKESILLGRLAIRENLVSEADVNTCLRLQAKDGEKRSLGEVMVEQGHLTSAQVKQLLSKQQKRIMSCSRCKLSFTVLSTTQTKIVHCPRCKGTLQEGKPSDSVRTDADLETSVANRVRKETRMMLPQARPSGSIRMVKMTCPMCGNPFTEPVDSKGRVDCPRCQSSFSA